MNRASKSVAVSLLALLLPMHALGGTFLFVNGEAANNCTDVINGGGSNCIFGMASPSQSQKLDTEKAARKFVQNAKSLGVTTFLLSPGLSGQAAYDQLKPLADAIQLEGLSFFVDQTQEFRRSLVDGVFQCSTTQAPLGYVQRAAPSLDTLKTEFPKAFIGISLDEPSGGEFENAKLFARCWRTTIPSTRPKLADIKLFVDLLPNYAAESRLRRPVESAGAVTACGGLYPVLNGQPAPQLADYPNTYDYLSEYCRYVYAAVQELTPDFVAFNFYPSENNQWAASAYPGNTSADLRDFMLIENYKALRLAVSSRLGVVAVSYAQSYSTFNRYTQTVGTPLADFNLIRWHAGLGLAYGVVNFANFVSHSFCGVRYQVPCKEWVSGWFDERNERDYRLFGADSSPVETYAVGMPGVFDAVATQLNGYRFVGTVFPHQGVLSASILGWLPSPKLVAGEYRNAANQTVLVFANRNYDLVISSQIAAFNRWYPTVEKFDFYYGVWVVQNTTSTNYVVFAESSFPFSMIRLTP